MARLPLALLALLSLCACGPAAPGASGTSPDQSAAPEEQEGPPGGGGPDFASDPVESAPRPPDAHEESAPPAGAGKRTPAPDGPPILAAHNRFRAGHCAPPLSWSKELVAESQRWAKNLAAHRCAFEHNPDPRYGENLSYFRPPGALSQEQVAEQWYREIDDYNFKKPGFSMTAGHFTQLVWVGTKRLGCASVECGGGELWVCNYDPPGNMEGDFRDNVRQAGCK